MASNYARVTLAVSALVALWSCAAPPSVLYEPGRGAALNNAAPPTYETRKSLLFEGEQNKGVVNVYRLKDVVENAPPIAEIQVAGCPLGLAMDSKGTLYVADDCQTNEVEEFPAGSTVASAVITNGIHDATGLAIDGRGTLYVSGLFPASIKEYPYGRKAPSVKITGQGLNKPLGLAADARGNLFIADYGAIQVFEVKAGTTTLTPLHLVDLEYPTGVAVDRRTGDLWVADGFEGRVEVYAPGSTTPIQTVGGFYYPQSISIQSTPGHAGTVAIGDVEQAAVYFYHRGEYTPYAKMTNGVTLPTALLITRL